MPAINDKVQELGHKYTAAAIAFFSSHPETEQAAVTLPSTQEAIIYNLSEYRSILLNIQTSLRHVQYGKFYWV